MIPITDTIAIKFNLYGDQVHIYYKGKKIATKMRDTLLRHFTDYEIGSITLPYSTIQGIKKEIRDRLKYYQKFE